MTQTEAQQLITPKALGHALSKFYSWAKQPQPDELIIDMWMERLAPLAPSAREFWAALTEIMFDREPGMVPIREITDLIRHARNKERALLPPAPEPPQIKDLPEDQRRNACLTVYATIFRDQGDTDFYRSMLKRNTVWGKNGFLRDTPEVTHEQVLAFMEQQA